MKDIPVFASPFGDMMRDFVLFKRMQGYDYSFRASELKLFDSFLCEHDRLESVLSDDTFRDYLAATSQLKSSTREGRLSAVRQFALYLHACRPESAIVPPGLLPRHPGAIGFHPLAPGQITELMEAAMDLHRDNGIRLFCIRFLIGLLYATGLRISEALALNLADVDRRRGTLFVRNGKFGKERIAALSASTLQAVDGWLERRSPYAGTRLDAPLLVGAYNKRLTCWQAAGAFKHLCRNCGIDGDPPARLHDLRHNFACHCLVRWREQGQDIQALLPVLANAMGHVNIYTTQVYIHTSPAILRDAGGKMHEYRIPPEEQS